MEIEESPGIEPDIQGLKFSDGLWQETQLFVPREFDITIYLNKRELVTILCSPLKLNCLVLGYLYSEGFIQSLKDVVSMRVCEDEAMADVALNRIDLIFPEKRVLTSGCGGGTTFNLNVPKISSNITVKPETLLLLMRKMMDSAETYNLSGGIHTAVISEGDNILAIAEDIGRHNTLDKLTGECMLRKIPTKDKIVLTSGRISSEMLRKTAVMQVPVVVSLTSPTSRAVKLAAEAGITLVGYARGNHLTIYAHPQRLKPISG
jgi:FdhD protein